MKRACIQIEHKEIPGVFAEIRHEKGEAWGLYMKTPDGRFTRFQTLSVYRIQDGLKIARVDTTLKFTHALRET